MRGRGLLLKLYIGVVALGGLAGLLWTVEQWEGTGIGVWELALFIGLAGVLDLMVVPVPGGGGVSASFAVLFGGLLVLGPGPTAWVGAVAGVWWYGVVRRTPASRLIFNSAHRVLSLLAAGAVYQGLGGHVGEVALLGDLPALVSTALVLWLLETGWMASAVALEQGVRRWRRLRHALVTMLVLDGALASVGLLLALLYQNRGELLGTPQASWSGALLLAAVIFIPASLLYYANRLHGDLQRVYRQSLRTLGSLVEAKLADTQPGHGERVAALAVQLAQTLELPPDQVEQIRYAGYLHDIGKVGVPRRFLHRRRDLFSGDPQPVRLHPQLGAQILTPIHFLGPAAEIVRAHHERWDGLGYPRGLRQQDIPLGARVLAIADAYVGLSHSLAHHSPHQSLSHLQQAAGSRFDPELVDTLAETLEQRAELAPQQAGTPEPAAN